MNKCSCTPEHCADEAHPMRKPACRISSTILPILSTASGLIIARVLHASGQSRNENEHPASQPLHSHWSGLGTYLACFNSRREQVNLSENPKTQSCRESMVTVAPGRSKSGTILTPPTRQRFRKVLWFLVSNCRQEGGQCFGAAIVQLGTVHGLCCSLHETLDLLCSKLTSVSQE